MKIKRVLWFVFSVFAIVLFSLVSVFGGKQVVVAETQNNTGLEISDKRLQDEYLDFYAVGNSFFTATNNGGAKNGTPLSNAFDRNFSTSFVSQQDNNVKYEDPDTGETISDFLNTIDITFVQTVCIDRIIYASENKTTRGFPTSLNVYADLDDGSGFTLIKNFQTSPTTNFVLFDFGKTINVKAIRLEYVSVVTSHRWCATAKEILFLQPETSDFEIYENLFTNYSETAVAENANTLEKLNTLERSLSENINFSVNNEKFQRARKVVAGEIQFNQDLEFSTNPNASNVLERNGDLASYCRNVLQMSAFGTNRQVTGISANAGDEIIIYVDAKDDDPLPKVFFSQHIGTWQKWGSGEIQLKKGKNVFTVASFYDKDSYVDSSIPLGGPLYLVNPFTESEQSANVKVYIEGGTLFPVFRRGVEESEYLKSLNAYAEKVSQDTENVIDITEIVSDHCILTIRATVASEMYSNSANAISPNKTTENWDGYIDKLLEFGGVFQDPTNELFDKRNLLIRHNIRITQAWSGGWMYSAGEFVGVRESVQSGLITGSGLGWGIAHELGHSLDNKNRIVKETSNNMWAKYNEACIENVGTRGNFEQTFKTLSSDDAVKDSSFFVSKQQNFLVWWYIETWQNGFWGKLDNCYRGLLPELNSFWNRYPNLKDKLSQLSADEKHVFFASIATGVDLTYYFDRWGFSLSYSADNYFKKENVGSVFSEFMQSAVDGGFVDNSVEYKLWYQDNSLHQKNYSKIYDSDVKAEISSVFKAGANYGLIIKHKEDENHLGYEIWAGDDVLGYSFIGFTYGNAFTDTTTYDEGYVPSYRVVAYDRTFCASAMSDPCSAIAQAQEVVCKIGTTEYNSLEEAVSNAKSGDIIKLLKSVSVSSIEIDKNILIVIDESVLSDIVLKKIQTGAMFTIISGVTLEITGSSEKNIILDNSEIFSDFEVYFNISGVVCAEYVQMKNIKSIGTGGAVFVQNDSKGSVFKNCKFIGNSSTSGSACYVPNASSSVTLENSEFKNNNSRGYGVVYNVGTTTIKNCTFTENTVKFGTITNSAGGVMYVNGCQFTKNSAEVGGVFYVDGYTEIKNSTFKENTADKASVLYMVAGNSVRKVILDNISVDSNGVSDVCLDSVASVLSISNVSLSEKLKFVVLKGEVKINNNCSFCADFVINNGAKLTFIGGLLGQIENCVFEIENFRKGMQVFCAENYEFTQNDVDQFKVETDNIQFKLEDNVVCAFPINVYLKLYTDWGSAEFMYDFMQKVVLDFNEAFPTKYIAQYVGQSGTYKMYDEILMDDNYEFDVLMLDKIKLEFVFGGVVDDQYFLPNQSVLIEGIKKEDIKFIGWQCGTQLFVENQIIVATKNMRFEANYKQLYLLEIKDGEDVVFRKFYESGTTVNLDEFAVENGNAWFLNGKRVKSVKIGTENIVVVSGDKSNIVLVVVLSVIFVVICSIVLLIVMKFRQKRTKVKDNNQ